MTQKHRSQTRPSVGLISFGSLGPIARLLGVVVFCFGLWGAVQRALGQCEVNEQAKLTASDAEAYDYFGSSVSLSADSALIGTWGDDDNGSYSGSAYVFRFDGAAWVQEAKLTASDGAADDRFGYSVSLSRDCALIGAFGHDGGGGGTGWTYVFRFHAETGEWEEEAQLTASDGAMGGKFGWSVALDGDRAVIGAPEHEHPGSPRGSAYVFRFDAETGEWVEEAELTASDGNPGGEFAFSVCIAGSVAVIGARGGVWAGPGSAYVYRFNGVDWIEEAKLTGDPSASNAYAHSVAISGERTVVGAPFDKVPTIESAYVYHFNGAEWIEEANLTASDAGLLDLFGLSVSINGETAMIGAAWHQYGGPGAAYVFHFDPGSGDWIEQAKLTASDGGQDDFLGSSVSLNGETALIGARFESAGGPGAGAAYVFRGVGDCNENGMLDACDIADGTSQDENGNGVPDECEMPGDMNCDRVVDTLDIDPFVLALVDPAAYTADYPDCDINHADTNADGALNAADIQSFVHLLVP